MRQPTNHLEFVSSNKLRSDLNPQESYTYDLQVYADEFRFTLSIAPKGEVIGDDFEGVYKRKPLYQLIENGEIYDWLCEEHKSILEESFTMMSWSSKVRLSRGDCTFIFPFDTLCCQGGNQLVSLLHLQLNERDVSLY
jgi:hypothetical protein